MKKAVLAIGNPMLGDDSVGILVLKELRGVDADLVDFGWGTDISLIRRYEKVAIVDAGFFGGKPGDFREFGLEELDSDQMPSTHGVNIVFLLKKFGNPVKNIRFFLVQPENNKKLSNPVKKSIPLVARIIRKYLEE